MTRQKGAANKYKIQLGKEGLALGHRVISEGPKGSKIELQNDRVTFLKDRK